MKKCKLSPDENKECSCVIVQNQKPICNIYDEQISKLKKCPIKNRKRTKIKQGPIEKFILQHRFLSNFYESSISYEGKVYPTAEHLFQTLKTKDSAAKEKIRLSLTPQLAKKTGCIVSLRKDWEKVKDNLMSMVVRLKFLQHQDLFHALLRTENRTLTEGNGWHDNYWGDCYCPGCKKIEGKNQLGKILMRIRKQDEG